MYETRCKKMQINPVNYSSGNVAMKRNNYNYSYSSKPSAKQIGTAAASAFIPGLGQAINNEWGKGLLFFGGALATGLLGRSCGKRGATVAAIVFGITQAAIRAYSTADAVLNTRY